MHLVVSLAMLIGCSGTGQNVVSVVPSAAPITTAMVTEGEFDETWNLVGRVIPRQHALLAASVSGEVRLVGVSPGDLVEEGAVVLGFDDALIKARMDGARAEQESHKSIASAYWGLRANLEGGDGTAADGHKASATASEHEARARAARGRLETLSVELVRHEVRAPFQGLVTRVYADVGDSLFTGDPVAEVITLGEVIVEVDAPGHAMTGIEPGQTATLEGGDVMSAEIIAVIPVIDPKDGTMRVRIQPAEPRPWLVAGATVHVRLPIVQLEEGLVIPRAALLQRGSDNTVVRVVDSRAVHVRAQVIATLDDEVLVIAPELEAGDDIVLTGHDRLRTGQLLQIMEP